MAKFNVRVHFEGSVMYVIEADSKIEADSEGIHKFIDEDLNSENVNQYIEECCIEEVEEVKE